MRTVPMYPSKFLLLQTIIFKKEVGVIKSMETSS